MDHPELNPDLINEFQKGDPHAFTYFFQLHYRPLCYFASQLVGSQQDAEDIVKDTYVKLWQKHTDFATPQNIKAFLYITTRNACLNFLRHLQVKESSRKELLYLEAEKGQELVVNQMIRAELMQEIYTEIEKLPEKRRMVFKMAYLDGLKNDEIADQMHISIHTVKEHKGKALQFLRLRFSDKNIILFILLCSQCMEVVEKH
ncbi:RNA polymerase sigma-70 factor [Flavitalea sp. BT771]|uniref:RNA polymerase sigma-70 factor n=1 Tax=Flavitalea sp. BT771 TaxID=3063329 RepID=UPI0026E27D02|nr:RNA polymerase sigma-70 factor [Flavitalea sp. BT771]MDO6433023.1 RNA polymerase sigma-70 factor [Flavitalea sp. BT771]MDV6221701.1 RNA polymerase sigma-70 factor [Flavitalea sp. BT771]